MLRYIFNLKMELCRYPSSRWDPSFFYVYLSYDEFRSHFFPSNWMTLFFLVREKTQKGKKKKYSMKNEWSEKDIKIISTSTFLRIQHWIRKWNHYFLSFCLLVLFVSGGGGFHLRKMWKGNPSNNFFFLCHHLKSENISIFLSSFTPFETINADTSYSPIAMALLRL